MVTALHDMQWNAIEVDAGTAGQVKSNRGLSLNEVPTWVIRRRAWIDVGWIGIAVVVRC